MNLLFIIIQYISATIETALSYMFIKNISEPFERKFQVHKIYIGAWILCLGAASCYNNTLSFFSSIWLVIKIIGVWISVVYIVRSQSYLYFLMTSIFYIVISLFDFLGAFAVVRFAENRDVYSQFLLHNSIFKIGIMLGIRVLMLCILLILERIIKKKQIEIQFNPALLTCMAIIGYVAVFYFQKVFVDEKLVLSISIWFFLLFLIVILVIVSALCLIYLEARQKERMISIRNELLEQNYNEMYGLYKQNAEQFHDFKNHINIIYEYCASKKPKEAMKYIDKIREPLVQVDKRVWSGNNVFDLILNYKKAEAEKYGIDWELYTDRIDLEQIEDYDLCSVMSNVLDNAIEACRNMKERKPWIKTAVRRKGNILAIKVNNSLEVKPVEKNGKLETIKDKKGFHGLGLASVKAVVNKYDGFMEYRYDEKEFELSITIYD